MRRLQLVRIASKNSMLDVSFDMNDRLTVRWVLTGLCENVNTFDSTDNHFLLDYSCRLKQNGNFSFAYERKEEKEKIRITQQVLGRCCWSSRSLKTKKEANKQQPEIAARQFLQSAPSKKIECGYLNFVWICTAAK